MSFLVTTTAAVAAPAPAAAINAMVVADRAPAAALIVIDAVQLALVPGTVAVIVPVAGDVPAAKVVVAMPCALVVTETLAPAAVPVPSVPAASA